MRVLSQNKLPVHQVGGVCCRSFDHHLFHLCTVPLSLDREPSLPHPTLCKVKTTSPENAVTNEDHSTSGE